MKIHMHCTGHTPQYCFYPREELYGIWKRQQGVGTQELLVSHANWIPCLVIGHKPFLPFYNEGEIEIDTDIITHTQNCFSCTKSCY